MEANGTQAHRADGGLGLGGQNKMQANEPINNGYDAATHTLYWNRDKEQSGDFARLLSLLRDHAGTLLHICLG